MQVSYAAVPQPLPSRADAIPYGFGAGRTVPQQTPPQQIKGTYGAQPGDAQLLVPFRTSHRESYMIYDSEGGRTHQQPHFPQAGYSPANIGLQNPLPATGTNMLARNPSHSHYIRNHPYSELIEKTVNMGFRGDIVVSVIQRMEESGQPVDFNAVLDRLNVHSSGGSLGVSVLPLAAPHAMSALRHRTPPGPNRSNRAQEPEEEHYNIIPIHNLLADHPSLRYPEVRAAAAALRTVGNLRKPPYSQWHPSMDLLDWLALFFGFQKDNVRNQREHIVLHLANAQMRLTPPPDNIDTLDATVLRRFRRKLLKNYTNWCSYLNKKSNIWISDRSHPDLRRELLLYLSIS
ncbi:hypothetical protein GH714_043581 [Hevea brasiliensis]|uniref:DUF1421 domain-containing protein n=1 Tax=Hevea brasiliensis TaxID=3981 RepID=A0A6A6K717_HEVBR|nr:hypothetical protein GH714_043581 [Hevea brasiliensis]